MQLPCRQSTSRKSPVVLIMLIEMIVWVVRNLLVVLTVVLGPIALTVPVALIEVAVVIASAAQGA